MKISTVIASASLVSCLALANDSNLPRDHTRLLKKRSDKRGDLREGRSKYTVTAPEVRQEEPKRSRKKYEVKEEEEEEEEVVAPVAKEEPATPPVTTAATPPATPPVTTAATPPATTAATPPATYGQEVIPEVAQVLPTPPAAYEKTVPEVMVDESGLVEPPVTATAYEAKEGICETDCAVDDPTFSKCPAPQVNAEDNLPEVSVCGDATYKLPAGVDEATICSGTGSNPTGTRCPVQGTETTLRCRENILSYMTGVQQGKTGCVAPEAAVCRKLLTGTWGCVFPGNCNKRNKCLAEEACTDEYQKDADGNCLMGENEYPLTNPTFTGGVNTTVAPELPIVAESFIYSTSRATAVGAVSGMVGLITIGTFVFSMM